MKTHLKIFHPKKISEIEVLFSEFPDKDTYCLIEDTEAIAGNHVLIAHDLYPNQNQQIVKLLLLIDLLTDLGAKSISVFVPYLPYARQDKRHIAGEAVSANTLSKMISRAGARTLYTFDCHYLKGLPKAEHHGLRIFNASLGPYLLKHFAALMDGTPFEVVGPDKGSSYLVEEYGGMRMQKIRGDYDADSTTRHRSISKLEHEHLVLQEHSVAIVDDMISTGGTLLKAVGNLHDHGVSDVYCIAVHGLFLNGCYEKLSSQVKKIIVSDTINHQESIPVVEKAWRQELEPLWIEDCTESSVGQ